ncbi:MAG: DNA topoisomerase, partial [Lachnospiraceae bacterium]|nr:DNA topoisomerase [Lachnospiraceae bacterium]
NLKASKLLFVTEMGMMKIVDTEEFDVIKKTVAATKLNDDDKVFGIYRVTNMENIIVVQTTSGRFLKFAIEEVPEKKKNAVGVRGIKLDKGAKVDDIYIISPGSDITIEYAGKEVSFKQMKMGHRDQQGVKK